MRNTIIKSVSNFAEVITGGTPSTRNPEYWDGDIPWLNSGALNDGDIRTASKYITELGLKNSSAKMMPKDSVLVALTGATTGQVGYLTFESSANQSVTGILPSKEHNPRYLYYYLKSQRAKIQGAAFGGAQPHINQKFVKDYKIPLPPLDDQKRIAHLLGKVERLIARRKQHLQQLDELLRSVFLKMFGDPITNPKAFPVEPLSKFYINPYEGTKCGPFGSALKKDELVESGIAVLNMDNIDSAGRMVRPFRMRITEEKYQDLRQYAVLDGDIIISRAGTVGKMCVVKMDGEHGIISTNLIRLRLGPHLSPLYFVSLMIYCKGRVGRLKTGADGAFTHMNTGILDKLEFPYPPIELQNQFAVIDEKVQRVKAQYQQSLIDLENLYGALSQKAFKGELDLSRVPLMPKQLEKVDAIQITAVAAEDTKAFELPTPADASDLTDAEGRMKVIELWLDSYLGQLNSMSFSAQDFMEKVQQKLWELLQDDAYQLSIAEYDHVKKLVFDALESGRLSQNFDSDGNRVLVTAAKGV